MKLTQKMANDAALPAGRNELLLFDDDVPGFGLRIGKKRKSWIVQWQQGARQRRMTIGHCGILSASKAREEAQTVLAKVRLGEDPQADKLARRHEVCVGDLVEPFLAQKQSKNRSEKTITEMRRYLADYAKSLHAVPVGQVDRSLIARFLADLTKSRSPNVADACRRNLSSFFGWAMRNGYIDTNPVLLTERPIEPSIRERLLSADEIRAIWQATNDGGDFAKIVRLLLLTGQRRQEIADLAWSEIDLEKRLIRLPGRRVKNKRPHIIPLSEPALAILQQTDKRTNSDHVFGEGAGPFSGFSRSKRNLDIRISEQTGAAPAEWRLHDLRRHADTMMRELGVNPWVVEAILNHLPQGVSRHYNFAQFEEERRAALMRLADYVLALVGADHPVEALAK